MKYTDAYRWLKGEAGVRQRIAYCFRDWCAREHVPVSHAHDALSVGWPGAPADATAAIYAGSPDVEYPKPYTIPNGRILWGLCQRLDINAEWLFTGRGPRSRVTVQQGGTLTAQDLAQQLAAHLVSACDKARRRATVAPPFGFPQLGADADAVLRDVTAAVVQQVLKQLADEAADMTAMRPVMAVADLARVNATPHERDEVARLIQQASERTRRARNDRVYAIGPIESLSPSP